jgi:hypothetical protein
MPRTFLFSALVLLIPASSFAADTAARCMALGQEIAGTTQVIGSTSGANSHAAALSRQNQEIRRLRMEMQEMGCGNGSIVRLGGQSGTGNAPDDGSCSDYAANLASMEENRHQILARRQAPQKVVQSLGRDEAALREEMRQLRCGEQDPVAIPASLGDDAATAAPRIGSNRDSSIIQLGTKPQVARQDATPIMPERDYDPGKPIRTVGPQFFPDDQNIDLASPKQPPRQLQE